MQVRFRRSWYSFFLFFIGAVLVANGTYTYLRMVQVLNLVVFTVTISSQLMGFSESFFPPIVIPFSFR